MDNLTSVAVPGALNAAVLCSPQVVGTSDPTAAQLVGNPPFVVYVALSSGTPVFYTPQDSTQYANVDWHPASGGLDVCVVSFQFQEGVTSMAPSTPGTTFGLIGGSKSAGCCITSAAQTQNVSINGNLDPYIKVTPP